MVLYEFLFGDVPYFNDQVTTDEDLYALILHSVLQFPANVTVSYEAKDLISALLMRNPKERLGYQQGIKEV